jgi:hypothetical protein
MVMSSSGSNNGKQLSRKYRKRRRLNYTRSNGRPPGSKNHEGHSAGALEGNQNGLSHGLIAFRNQVKRRTRKGRSLIDRRSAAGKNAVAIGDQLLADLGGEENCSTAKLMLIEMVRRDVYFLDEIDRRTFRFIHEADAKFPESKRKNPKYISGLYSYRQGVVNNLARNLSLLGLEKIPPKQKTLEEILNEPDEPEGDGQDKESAP